jgi:Flp pilus assembly pilin Flp
MMTKISDFLASETGAVTVDWVVLTGAMVGTGIAAATAISNGIDAITTDIAANLSTQLAYRQSLRRGGVMRFGQMRDPCLAVRTRLMTSVTLGPAALPPLTFAAGGPSSQRFRTLSIILPESAVDKGV